MTADFLDAAGAGKTFVRWRYDFGRKSRAAEFAATAKPLPGGEKRWPIILADPPWDHNVPALESSWKHPSEHYSTMPLAEICALQVNAIAADDCVLFLWTTVSHLEESFAVLRAWGFQYKSDLVWDKELIGWGHWARGQHEHLLIAVKGNPPTPLTDALSPSVIRERRREHSRKPEASYAITERMYPDLPKIELFARQARPGWAAWGNEVTGWQAQQAGAGAGGRFARRSEMSALPVDHIQVGARREWLNRPLPESAVLLTC